MPSVGSQVQVGRVGKTVGEVVGVVGEGANAQVTGAFLLRNMPSSCICRDMTLLHWAGSQVS